MEAQTGKDCMVLKRDWNTIVGEEKVGMKLVILDLENKITWDKTS